MNNISEQEAGEALSECVLGQYQFCIAGVGLGVGYGLKFPKGKYGKYMPLMIGGVTGSLSDLLYAFNVSCVQEAEAYKYAKQQRAIHSLVDNTAPAAQGNIGVPTFPSNHPSGGTDNKTHR